ncbi:MAG: sensor domain-containing protein [Microthrixaceae bacterium]
MPTTVAEGLDPTAWLAALIDSSSDAMIALDLHGTVLAWSPSAGEVLGYTAAEMVGRRVGDLLIGPAEPALAELLGALGTGTDRTVETTVVHKEGRRVHVSATLAPIRDDLGDVCAISAIVRDVTSTLRAERHRRRAEQDIATQQQILEQIARGDDLTLVLADLCREVEARYPGALCSLLMVDPVDRVLLDTAGPSLPAAFRAAIDGIPVAVGMGSCGTAAARGVDVIVRDMLNDPTTAPFADLAREHDLRSVWSHAIVDQTGRILGTFAVYSAVVHEPTEFERRLIYGAGRLAGLAIERRHYEDALQTAALVDPLTGLPNRNQFLQVLAKGLEDVDRSLAVLFLDLDQFKTVNDTLGHPAGDRLLREASRRLMSALREDDVLSRFGGDEFTVLIRDAEERGLTVEAERLLATFADPFTLDDREFFITASIGVAIRGPASAPFDLIRDADVAMYQAKARGPGQCAVFDEDLRTRTLARVTLDAELRRAFERHELVVHYQPIFELATGRCTGAEALVRWLHPVRGLLPPSEFVPLAEETGLVLRLGATVLDEVLSQIRRWGEVGIDLPIAINVSPIELSNPSLVDEIEAALDHHRVAPNRLLLEITETAVMEQIDSARRALERATGLGVGVFIDDFGTGYSSISRLSDLPVMGLKVDRRFTVALGLDPSITKVTMAIIDLARALDLEVVAEGIETNEALEELIALECGHGQGYHLGMPAGPEAITELFTGVRGYAPTGPLP